MDDGQPRLRINRLFTISTPHRGAKLAAAPTLNSAQIDMRIGSPFLQSLENVDKPYARKLYAYVRLGDEVVGEQYAAPAGHELFWLPNLPLQPSHILAPSDPRILADIFRRLRNEPPYARSPAEPLPNRDG